MRKRIRYISIWLSAAMIMSAISPSAVSAASEDEIINVSEPDTAEILADGVDGTDAETEEYTAAASELPENEVPFIESISTYADPANEGIQTYEETAKTDSEGYTRAYYNKALDYGFKYVESEKTLYIKVWDNVATAAINGARSPIATGWVYHASYCPNGLPIEIIRSIEKVVIGQGITSIGRAAFKNTKSATAADYASLKEVILNDDLTEIVMNAFEGTPIEKIDCKNVNSIGISAFSNCDKLSKIVFGNKDVTFGGIVFSGDNALNNICYAGSRENWNKISAGSGISNEALVHCKGDTEKPKAATCTEPGLKELTCAVCGETYTDGTEIPALDHDYSEEYTVDKAATCTEAGSESKHCTRCGEVEAGSEKEIPALGHDYVAEVTTQPTCTKEGVRTLTCSRCNDTKTEAIPATGEHVWSDWKKTADATVFAAEQQERACATCDAKENRTVGEKLAATLSVNASSVTLKQKQSTSYVKVSNLANGDSIVSWTSTNPKVFTVSGKADGSCKLTGVKKGSAKLEITLASGLKKTISVKVQTKTVATTKISGLAKKLTVKKGEKTTLHPVLTPFTSGQKLTYTSSNKRVATVSSKGVITAKKAGTAKITVKSGSKKVTVTVTVPKAKTTAIKVSDAVSVKKGKTYNLKAKVTPSNSDEKITYSSSNKKIATVSKSGKIKGIKKGEAVITVKSGKIVKKVKVTVK